MPRSESRIVGDMLMDLDFDYYGEFGILYVLYHADRLSPNEIYDGVDKKFGEASFSNKAGLSFKDAFLFGLRNHETNGLIKREDGTYAITPLGARVVERILPTEQYNWPPGALCTKKRENPA